MANIFKKLFDNEYKELKRFNAIATKIDALDEDMSKLSDKKLANKTSEFKERLANGEDLEDVLVEAFATIREAAYRIIGEKAYFCQLVGGLAIHYGNIAEMKTGEGKTLTTIFPAYLNALTGEGVHVVTVNEYLTQRNAEWMGPIFEFLGLSVGINLRDKTPEEKREEYAKDILYTTNNELGFDYLRDNMVVTKEKRVQRPLNFCIIDEVDSILIDEARTPLIISGGVMQAANLYTGADFFVKGLKENEDYIKDEKTRSINLTDEGSRKAEKHFNIQNGVIMKINKNSAAAKVPFIKPNVNVMYQVDFKRDDSKPKDPETNIHKYGCNFMCCLAIPQFMNRKKLQPSQIIDIYLYANKCGWLDYDCTVNKPNEIITKKDLEEIDPSIKQVENQGKHKLLFYIGKDYYEFKGGERFSSYKYYLMFNRINNTLENTL